jgi:hypothetical protein
MIPVMERLLKQHQSAFQFCDYVNILLHTGVAAFAFLVCPGIVFGFAHKIEHIGWTFLRRIALGGLFVQAVQLQQYVVGRTFGKLFAFGNCRFKLRFQIHGCDI